MTNNVDRENPDRKSSANFMKSELTDSEFLLLYSYDTLSLYSEGNHFSVLLREHSYKKKQFKYFYGPLISGQTH